jgi:hypothetical protein
MNIAEMVEALDTFVGRSDDETPASVAAAGIPGRAPIVRAANEDGSYTLSDGHRHTLRAETPPCTHADAHHGVAGKPGLHACDECGRTWSDAPPFDPRTAK